jgi:hypothetical protein
VNNAKVAPKVVQTILRHSRIQTTLDIYTQGGGDETRAVQCAFLTGDLVLASNCNFANPFFQFGRPDADPNLGCISAKASRRGPSSRHQ